MPLQSSPETSFQKLHETVEQGFQKYRKTSNPAALPDVSSLWNQFKVDLDIDTFLKPIVRGCHDLIYDDSLCRDQRSNLAKDLGCICADVENIQQSEQGIDLSCFLAWLKFHLARLRGLTLAPFDGKQLNEWLRMCYGTEDRRAAHFFALFRLGRDEEMRRLVFDEQGRVRDFFCSEVAPGRLYLPKLAEWFLRRYDLAAAFALLKTMTLGHSKADKAIQSGLGQQLSQRIWKPFVLSGLLLLFLLLSTSGYLPECWPLLTGWMHWLPVGRNRLTNTPLGQTWRMLPYPIGSGMLMLIGVLSVRRRHWRIFYNLRRLLPRLLGGILVGYIPLMSAGDPWKWLLQMPVFPATVLWLLMLLVSLGYLYVEARNTLAEGELPKAMRKELRIRVAHVFFIGLSEALIIGIILSEVFGDTVVYNLLKDMEGTAVVAVTGWLGYIFPKVILLYAPFALFLGILVQLVWDEKTVAQPL